MSVTTKPMRILPFKNQCGAEIVDVNLAHITDGEAAAIRQAYLDHQIVVVRDQSLSPQEQFEFSARFGPIEQQENHQFSHPENDKVVILSNEIRDDGTAVGVVDAGDFWHSDSSHHAVPVTLTILQSVVNPRSGGTTDFCNMYAAFSALPDQVKEKVAGRSGIHHVSKALNPRVVISNNRPDAKAYYEKQVASRAKVAQPIVRTHEETGRQALYVSPRFTIGIEGMEDAEAQPLLDQLFASINDSLRPYHYLHRYRDGDLILWDNRCLVHRAMGGYKLPDIRRMHRTTVAGETRPFYRPD